MLQRHVPSLSDAGVERIVVDKSIDRQRWPAYDEAQRKALHSEQRLPQLKHSVQQLDSAQSKDNTG